MKDERGTYYYPFPNNRRVHMYVKESEGAVWFRLWNADDPQLWEQHDWVPHGAILKAADMYTGKAFDPRRVAGWPPARPRRARGPCGPRGGNRRA
jgi:hypothetical protein